MVARMVSLSSMRRDVRAGERTLVHRIASDFPPVWDKGAAPEKTPL
jgi:hypothetical protein